MKELANKPSKLFFYISMLTMVIAFIFLFIIGFWLYFPYKIVSFKDTSFPIVNKTIKAGDSLQYVVSYCKTLNIPTTVTRSFVNGIIYTTPTVQVNRELGCHINTVYFKVPNELPQDDYHLQILYRYQVNPIRAIDIIKETEIFSVINTDNK